MPLPQPEALLAAAVQRLREGGTVAFPTETVYGLGADARNPAAVARVFALKGRPGTNPLIVHVADEGMARGVAAEWTDDASRLARAFWPGPLTLIVPLGPGLPDAVTAGGPTVGVRCPDHPMALALIRAFGGPLVGPSANPSGRLSPTTAAHVRESFSEQDVLVLDGGPCRAGIESTVVALAPRPRVLRPGLISADEIARVLRRRVGTAPSSAPGTPLQSPGLLAQHYAPVSPARLFTATEWPAGAPAEAAVLAISPLSPAPARLIRMPAGAREYASRLYAALREADACRPPVILIERVPTGPLWDAIADRLARATSPGD